MHKEKYTVSDKEICLNIVQNQIDAVRKKEIIRTGLRIYEDGKIGVGGALGSYDEKDLEKLAFDALKAGIPYPYLIFRRITKTNSKKAC